jgi:hypothetical protein
MAQAALKNGVTTSPETARSIELFKFAAPEICHDVFEQTCITFARGASEWGAKTLEAMSVNANNMSEFAGKLAAARSWPEVVAVYSSQARKQFETLATEAQGFSDLSQKIVTDTLAPVTSALPEMFNSIAASRWR